VQVARAPPLQEPPHALPSDSHGRRVPTGEPVTAVQAPTCPGWLQASHWPVQPPSQQTPSTQWSAAHWPSFAHAAPFASLATQRPAAHQSLATQSASEWQIPAPWQAVGPHTSGVQAWVCLAGQVPTPWQAAERTATPAAQLGARQPTTSPG